MTPQELAELALPRPAGRKEAARPWRARRLLEALLTCYRCAPGEHKTFAAWAKQQMPTLASPETRDLLIRHENLSLARHDRLGAAIRREWAALADHAQSLAESLPHPAPALHWAHREFTTQILPGSPVDAAVTAALLFEGIERLPGSST